MGDPSGQIKIIAGKWRGRNLKVLTHPGLRPTPSRVRETLFNWLNPYIVNACCLDLFAGSGALGFEALSRGAKRVIFIDNFSATIKAIEQSAKLLEATSDCEIIRASAVSWLQQISFRGPAFDIIFLDPPFNSPLLGQSIALLAKSALVNEQTLIYMETAKGLTSSDLPPHWELIKQKTTGEVAYHLVRGGGL